jgi:hypothetical protein
MHQAQAERREQAVRTGTFIDLDNRARDDGTVKRETSAMHAANHQQVKTELQQLQKQRVEETAARAASDRGRLAELQVAIK